MTLATPQVSLNGSKLIRFLSDLAVSDVELSHKHFSDRLGRLLSMSDSIALADAHGMLRRVKFEPKAISIAAINESFVQARATMVQMVINSFDSNATASRLKLPPPDIDGLTEKELAYGPYLRFYAAHQREFESRVQPLQIEIRTAISGVSPTLAQLAILDKALGETLLAHSRKCFAVTPRVLEKRFSQIYQQHFQHQNQPPTLSDSDPTLLWTAPGGPLEIFCKEMQGILLAELEVRLLPILGLMEAANEQEDRN